MDRRAVHRIDKRSVTRLACAAGLALTLAACATGKSAPADAASPAAIGDGAADAVAAEPDAAADTPDATSPAGFVFDHRHTDLGEIPASCIEAVEASSFVFHYAHRSHGSQIIVGAESIANGSASYGFAASYCSIPDNANALSMWDGMTSSNLVAAEAYWASTTGLDELRSILTTNPSIRYTMWAWSFEISEQTPAQVQQYLDTMNALEAEFPNVTFIYMTGPAQGTYQAVNRLQRNQQIRDFCREHGKVLYDFGDLDTWWNGEHHSASVEGVTVPMEHPRYSLDTDGNVEYEWTHTTQESCETKARAFWRMVAALEGCASP